MGAKHILQTNLENEVENPLIWPLLSILRTSQTRFKVHNLASQLKLKGLLPDLDNDANKDLFKRNFLLMNALYQLQAMLMPEQWLQVQAMDIQLSAHLPSDIELILEQDIALRDYYLDWDQYDTSSESIEMLFDSFWRRYDAYLGKDEKLIDKTQALEIFELNALASNQDIRRRWRKLALKWHPDRASGNAIKFQQVCMAWQKLRI